MKHAISPVKLLEAISRTQAAFIGNANIHAAFEGLLDDLVRLTASQLGFIGTISPGNGGHPEMVMAGFSGMATPPIGMPSETSQLFRPELGAVLSNPESLFGRAILTRQAVIARSPETDAISANLPPGHPPITTFLALPIIFGEDIVALAGLANRAEAYSQSDVEALIPLTAVVAQLLAAERQAAARSELEVCLRESEGKFRSVLDHAPIGIWLLNSDGRLGFVNKSYCDAVGIPEDKFTSAPDYSVFYDPEGALRCKTSDAEALAADGQHLSEERIQFVDGQMHDLEIVKVRLLDEQGRPNGKLIGLSVDVTTRRQAEHRVKLLAAVFENAREGITLTNVEGNIVDVNPRFCEITGYSRDEVIGKNPRFLSSGRHDASFYSAMWHALKNGGHWQGEIWNRRKNGETYPELLSISLLKGVDTPEDYYLAVFTDISDLKAHQDRLEHLAHFDALTHLPNRVLLADRLQIAMSQARRSERILAVCFLDLDGFKPINDQHGHQFGDRLLVEVAKRLSQSLRGGDSVARLGGDEFVLLLNNVESSSESDGIINRLLHTIAEPIVIGNEVAKISASVGVTLYPEDDSDADTLLRHADQALYAAKDAGRNRFHLFDTLHDYELRARREGLARFSLALNSNQLRLYYQPKINMRKGKVIGAEALIRWHDPEIGLIMPAQFLHFVQGSAADIALGEWVIQEALRQTSEWRRAGLELVISVNISAYHLAQEDFVSRLRGFLGVYPEMPAHCLEIEILETAALEDITHITALMAECHALGVDFALDDFGTGYSSLTYFKRLPATTLKIDQSFIRDMLNDDDDLAIVDGIISLSQAFRRTVIAEGVETIEHGIRLLQMGCDLAQGYGFARPIPADEFPAWLADWRLDGALKLVASVQSSSEESGLLMAEEDHRRWLLDLKAFLLADPGANQRPPPLDKSHCRLGHWIEGIGSRRFSHLEKFAQFDSVHGKLHAAGQSLVTLHETGFAGAARLKIQELDAISDELVAGMHALLIAISMG
jgi:diguanylate cyclase (GGDEF)-like protein/PAS domain S-box-containing protein